MEIHEELKMILRSSLFVRNAEEEGELILKLNRMNAKLREMTETTESLQDLYEISSLIEERIRRYGL